MVLIHVILNSEVLEEVDCFKHLGSQVAADDFRLLFIIIIIIIIRSNVGLGRVEDAWTKCLL